MQSQENIINFVKVSFSFKKSSVRCREIYSIFYDMVDGLFFVKFLVQIFYLVVNNIKIMLFEDKVEVRF